MKPVKTTIAAIALCMAMLFALAGCGSAASGSAQSATSASDQAESASATASSAEAASNTESNSSQSKAGVTPKNQGEKIENRANEGELLLFINCGQNNVEKTSIPSTADDGTALDAENFMDYYNLYTYEYDGKTWMLNEALYDFDDKGRVFLSYTEYQESAQQDKAIQVYANIDYASQDVKGSFSEGSVEVAYNNDGSFDVAAFMEKYCEVYGNAGSITLANGKVLPLTDLNIQFAEGRVYMIYGKGLSLEDTQ